LWREDLRTTIDAIMIVRRDHPVARRIRALLRSRERARTGRFLAEGIKVTVEALACGADVIEAAVSPRLDRHQAGQACREALVRSGIRPAMVADSVLDSLSAAETHQGVVAVIRSPRLELEELCSRDLPVLVVAAGIQDPGNLGALVRITEAFGGGGLIACLTVDPWNPKAVRSAAGSLFRVPVVRTRSTDALVSALRLRPRRLVASVAAGGARLETGLPKPPLAVLFGSEAHGLEPALRAVADDTITIALQPPVESLNVCAAAAVVLWAAGGARTPAT